MKSYTAKSEEITKRPDRYDDRVVRDIAKIILPSLKRWLNEIDCIEEEGEDYEEMLYQVLTDHIEWDGFHLAKTFEQRSYIEGDEGLVDVFSHASLKRYSVLKGYVKDWVEDQDIELTLSTGDEVYCYVAGDRKTGKIVFTRDDTAEYSVRTEKQRTSSYIVGCENVFLIEKKNE